MPVSERPSTGVLAIPLLHNLQEDCFRSTTKAADKVQGQSWTESHGVLQAS